MKEPWGEFDPLQWRIWADHLMESGAETWQIKRAVKYSLGLSARPRLVLVGDARPPTCYQVGVVRPGTPVSEIVLFRPRWWVMSGLVQNIILDAISDGYPIPLDVFDGYLATPASFPGMVEARPRALEDTSPGPCWYTVVSNFYRKASEHVAVRCRKGEISVRRGRPARTEWVVWDGVE